MGKEKCCANCEWCISPENEEEIMHENHYAEDDPNRPHAGDCGWGYDHHGKYVCENHRYISALLSTYVLFDDKYLGPGYFIITKYDDEIIRFVKMYRSGSYASPSYSVRAYEIGSVDPDNQNLKEVAIEASIGEPLFEVISTFAESLNMKCLFNIDTSINGQNDLSAEVYKNNAYLVFTKDFRKVKDSSNFVDIALGDRLSCTNYEAVSILFKDLAKISQGQVETNHIKKILKISK